MAKSAKKPAPAPKPQAPGKETKAAKLTSAASGLLGQAAKSGGPAKSPNSESKQTRVLSMLRSPTGATIAAMMLATGWQQHSVRGFLAGFLRKRLKLKLTSKKLDGTRVYQIAGGADAKAHSQQRKRRRLWCTVVLQACSGPHPYAAPGMDRYSRSKPLCRGTKSRFRSISRIACMPKIIGSFAGSPAAPQSASAKRSRTSPVVRCCRPAAWPRSFQSSGMLLPI
jgi:hypothetical protein